jgi:protein-disulfide isomerase-like protein with CxxC motif
LTDALYLDGREPDAPDTIRDVANGVGLDGDALVTRWSSPEAPDALQVAFAHARSIGITTYPSLFVEWQGERVPILAGWADADTIVDRLTTAVP